MLSKFWKAPEDFVHKVPDDVSLKEAVLVEPLSVAVHASRLAKIKPGDTVVITGSGTIGLLCGAISRAFRAHRIIIVDILEDKLRFTSPKENADILTSRYDLQGRVDVIIEASGAESSVQMGIYLLKSGGSYVQTGIGKPMLQVPMLALSEKELRLRGCFRYGAGDFDLAIKLLSRRSVNLSPLISSVTPFERATEVWDMTSSGKGIKNLIQGVRD
ncbi:D-xylulose reductase A [Metarhizium rileyi]|uniref:D-xylulose reductase A n=1 Tax=Metarhizium rileyi (strain RCEF 4871) TaxID=1649241 RepID=A0A167AM20_METRR|nr:D-xylulose reductase A [Metarhizium rileyi RCEF 4871]